MKLKDNNMFKILCLVIIALVMRFCLKDLMSENYPQLVRIISMTFILIVGAGYVLKGIANIIEETTEVLSEKTKIAGGLLQSLGTAFPDMILGITAAVISLKIGNSDYQRAINYAIIAASTTFGSNIYNVGHAAWCIFRQNLANAKNKKVLMFPFFKQGGSLTPLAQHKIKPSSQEIETAIDVSTALTILTTIVAVTMVVFGKINNPPSNMTSDLYQLIRPVGIGIFLLTVFILFYFRKTKRPEGGENKVVQEENYYRHRPMYFTWVSLALAGIGILFAAETMVAAIEVFSELTHISFVISGIFAGIIGCLGEMIVVHNFSVNPNGRIGDAIVGVAMDNIVTTMGASIVAIMGGIFLGGNALILIFITILCLNSLLVWQIAKLKNSL
jgi:hypothetical protein